MGSGKLLIPTADTGEYKGSGGGDGREGRNGREEQIEDGTADNGELTPFDIVSELMYAGKTVREIAGYDTVQMLGVIWRKRDKYGKLIRNNDLPEGVEVDEDGMRTISNPVPFRDMFIGVRRNIVGESDTSAEAAWERYCEDNPKLGIGGE